MFERLINWFNNTFPNMTSSYMKIFLFIFLIYSIAIITLFIIFSGKYFTNLIYGYQIVDINSATKRLQLIYDKSVAVKDKIDFINTYPGFTENYKTYFSNNISNTFNNVKIRKIAQNLVNAKATKKSSNAETYEENSIPLMNEIYDYLRLYHNRNLVYILRFLGKKVIMDQRTINPANLSVLELAMYNLKREDPETRVNIPPDVDKKFFKVSQTVKYELNDLIIKNLGTDASGNNLENMYESQINFSKEFYAMNGFTFGTRRDPNTLKFSEKIIPDTFNRTYKPILDYIYNNYMQIIKYFKTPELVEGTENYSYLTYMKFTIPDLPYIELGADTITKTIEKLTAYLMILKNHENAFRGYIETNGTDEDKEKKAKEILEISKTIYDFLNGKGIELNVPLALNLDFSFNFTKYNPPNGPVPAVESFTNYEKEIKYIEYDYNKFVN